MKKTLAMTLVLIAVFACSAFAQNKDKKTDAKKDVPVMKPTTPAQGSENKPAPDDAGYYKSCFLKCKSRIAEGIILKGEGIACIELCLTDLVSSASPLGILNGRLYVKTSNGKIEKGLKVPVKIIALGIEPKEKPADFDKIRENVAKLIKTPIESKKRGVCSTPAEFPNCGYGMEKDLALFTVGTVMTDIDAGTFTIAGIPDGIYALWVDWYVANPNDPNTGVLYRWLTPFQISDGKPVNADLNEDNLSYILSSFPRSYFGN